MNPVKYLWDELKRRIQGKDPALETLGQLLNTIQEECRDSHTIDEKSNGSSHKSPRRENTSY